MIIYVFLGKVHYGSEYKSSIKDDLDPFEETELPRDIDLDSNIDKASQIVASITDLNEKSGNSSHEERLKKFDAFMEETIASQAAERAHISDEDLKIIGDKLSDIKLKEFGYDDRIIEESIASPLPLKEEKEVPVPKETKLPRQEQITAIPKTPNLLGKKPLAKSKPNATVSPFFIFIL